MKILSFKPFQSINEIKSKSEFFKKGQVIPKRILKVCKPKSQHKLTFHNDCYAFSTPNGYIVFVDNTSKRPEFANVRDLKNAALEGSPYGGRTHWYGILDRDPIEFVCNFNNLMAKAFNL